MKRLISKYCIGQQLKLNKYMKEPILNDEFNIPWKVEGQSITQLQCKEQEKDQRMPKLNDEKIIHLLKQYFNGINNSSLKTLQSVVEFSFANEIYKELRRYEYNNYNLKFEVESIENIELIIKESSKESTNVICRFNWIFDIYVDLVNHLKINEVPFTIYFKKRNRADDTAFISLWLDIIFDFKGRIELRRNEECIFDINSNSCHEIRVEVDIIECDYRRLKQQIEEEKGNEYLKKQKYNMSDPKLLIVDIDKVKGGNEYI